MFIVNLRDKKLKSFNLYLLSDAHVGRVGFVERKLKRAIEMIKKDRKALAVVGGDMVESIMPEDKRYHPKEVIGRWANINQQTEWCAKFLKPIKDKIICKLDGNHEEKHDLKVDITDMLLEKMNAKNIPHGGRTAKIIFSDNIKTFHTHGSGLVNSMAGDPEQRERNDAIRIKRKLMHLQGDCIIMSMEHIHKLRICKPVSRLAIVGDKPRQIYTKSEHDSTGFIDEDKRWYCSTGSFVTGYLEGVTTYVEKGMFPPTELGMIKATIKNDTVINVEKIIL